MLRFSCCAWLLWAASFAQAQTGAKNGEWTTYGGDLGSTRYSPLDQINAGNFNKLDVAWRFRTESLGPHPEYQYEGTPLFVHGRLYVTAGARRDVVCLDAVTGELIWMHGENEGERAQHAPRQLSGHGVAYWTDGKEERILYATTGYRLVALNAKTGVPVPGFGTNGIVDLKENDDQQMDLVNAEIGLHSTPIVAKNVVVVGAAFMEGGSPTSKRNEKGYIRGFDVRTGKRLWIFHTIPRPGEFGIETWLNDSWSYTGNAGVWGQMSVDPELNTVYLPVELPTGDYYGGHRPGPGLFGESIVALDLDTGKRKWHYQFVHHGLWDMDIPCAPILTDLNVDGHVVKALAQPTKQSFLYVLDRTNGKPIWPIVETPVAKGDVPDEWYSPTQPIPSKPPAYDNQGVTPDKLIDFTPALHEEAMKLISHYRYGPLFTPPSLSTPESLGTLTSPGSQGGTNWPGGSYDPETHTVYVFSETVVVNLGLIKPPAEISDMNYINGTAGVEPRPHRAMGSFTPPVAGGGRGGRGGGGGFNPAVRLTVQGLPLLKPPYGRITAINLETGDFRWQIAHGDTPDYIKNNPALKGVDIKRTGRPGLLGPLTTKTLVICGEAGFNTTPGGVRGAMLRAYDKMNGNEVGAVYIPAPQSGSPMTYMQDGEQYLVLAVGGAGFPGELIAFKLAKD